MPFSPNQAAALCRFILHRLKPGAVQKAQSLWKHEAERGTGTTAGKTSCFCFFGVRVETEEMGNPLKPKCFALTP